MIRVAVWLFVCAALTFAMVVVGGITRLTESGLSIVEWQPLAGALPPLSQADWEALFGTVLTAFLSLVTSLLLLRT